MSGSVELEKFIDESIERSIEKGFTPQVFMDMRHRHGTVEAIKKLLASKDIQAGLRRLGELGLLGLSAEAAVLEFPEEFTPEEQKVARWKLEEVGKDFGFQIEETPQTAEDYFNRAFKRYTGGNYSGAIRDYTKGLHLQPNDIYAWLNRGNAWVRKSEYDEAITDYSRAIHLKQDFAAAWSSRGEAWYRKSEDDKAIDDLNEALRLSPNSVNAWRFRGNAWRRRGEYERAIADYKEVLRFSPEDEEIKRDLNVALALQASKAERDEAVENVKQEYEKVLTEAVEKSVGQISKDRTAFRSLYRTDKMVSCMLRVGAVILLVNITFMWIWWYIMIYNFEMQRTEGSLGPDVFLSWAPVLATPTIPLLVVVWLLLRWGYEIKTTSYVFQRQAVLEEIILFYFGNDIKELKNMQKLLIANWMEKSPFEAILAIRGKRRHGGETPAEAALEKLDELPSDFKSKLGKNDS